MTSVRSTRGSWPWRLITSQATSTRLNQRRVARSRSVVASQLAEPGGAPHDDAERARGPGRPRPSPSSDDADAPEDERARAPGATSSPHPRTSECHPGVGAEGPDVLALRHRAGAGDGRGARRPSARSTTKPKWASTKPTSIRATIRASTIATKRAIRAEAFGSDRLDLRRRERHARAVGHGPGRGHEVGHLDRGELAEAPDLAGDLDRDDLTGAAVADDEEVDLVDGDALGVDLLLLGVEVDDSVRPVRPRRSARHWCRRANALVAPSSGKERPSHLLRAAERARFGQHPGQSGDTNGTSALGRRCGRSREGTRRNKSCGEQVE